MGSAVLRALLVAAVSLASACHSAGSPIRTTPAPARATACARDEGQLGLQRERAVHRGLDFMANYLAPDERLRSMGTDGTLLFLEFALTSSSPSVRAQADPIARRFALQLLPRYLEAGGIRQPWDFANALELLVDAGHLGIPAEGLQTALLSRFHEFARDDEAYGVPLSSAASLSDVAAFDLLLMAYAFERANVVWPGRFPVRFGLEDALDVVWRRPLAPWAATGTAATRGKESAYLATHVALVITEYGRHALPPDSLGRFEAFLRAEFAAFLRARDVEIVAETADVLRQLGETDDVNPQLCAATRLLLDSQRADGSWGGWERERAPYDAVHETWAAVTGLVDRMRGDDGPYAHRMMQILGRVRRSVDAQPRTPARSRETTEAPTARPSSWRPSRT